MNCYVLITGYFLINNTIFNIKRFEKVWLHALFYSLLFSTIAFILYPDLIHLKKIFSPFFNGFNDYWFVNKYLGLILLSPFLARFASLLKQSQYFFLLFILFIINVGSRYTANLSMGEASGGYSLQWFIFLFFVAGYIRRYNPFPNNVFNIKGIVVCFLLLFFYQFSYFILTQNPKSPLPLILYNGLCFFLSVFFFLWFKNHEFNSHLWKPLVFVAPYTFGVYLFHENSFVRDFLYGLFNPLRFTNTWLLIPFMLFECFIIFILGATFDFLRSKLVDIIHGGVLLDKFNNYVEFKCKPMVDRLMQRFSIEK